MKLFQKLLLGPAALGLLSPIAVSASEANFKDTSDYSQSDIEVSIESFKPLSSKNPLLAGGEGASQNSGDSTHFDEGIFSTTTEASFTANFAAGSIDDGTGSTTASKTHAGFDYVVELSTGFTGNDSLDVELESGNLSNLSAIDFVSTSSQAVQVASISYTKELGDRLTVFFGDGAAGSTLYNTACVYNGQTDALDDCGNLNSAIDEEFGTAAGLSIDLGGGFLAAIGVESKNNSTGIFTNDAADAYGAQVSYTGDNYGVSVTFANIENHDALGVVLPSVEPTGASWGNTQSTAVNAYFAPELNNFPSISVGFESNHNDSINLLNTENDSSHYFVGFQWDELGNGSFGGAFGTKTPTTENAEAQLQYEAYYAYDYADGITITPLFYSRETTGASNDTGVVLKTTFEF